ncbi:MAG: hypothetical protein GTO45_21480 [Candidatus Aminicenantes bacterium]|nr:hypothetical protein [Candidatus Aminicenantes bacterium]NIM81328.1 hypothetical protein [Candidatus Aminicenantes bacterium]NIN20738.1 hypothetical protein [Candidatus Aminicenantes bacterium]NIN44516.1 hypothetical protein [Candidatus Aminicenantes bacterium]NIN87336.1 hypothetical protein [Candidatus Aminicenantes bacterium]
MASYNYYTILRDGTYGVHNPVYIRQLLEHSIEALRRPSARAAAEGPSDHLEGFLTRINQLSNHF